MGNSGKAAAALLKHVSSPEVAGTLFQLASFDGPVTAGAHLPSAIAADAYSAPVDVAITAAQSCADPVVLARFAKSPRVTQRRAVAANAAISLETAERLLAEAVKKGDGEMLTPLADRIPPARYLQIAASEDSRYRRDTAHVSSMVIKHLMRSDDAEDMLEAAKAPDERLPAAALSRAHQLGDMTLFAQVLERVAEHNLRSLIVANYVRDAPTLDERTVAAHSVVERDRLIQAFTGGGPKYEGSPVTTEAFDVILGDDQPAAAVHLLASCVIPADRVDRFVAALVACTEHGAARRFITTNAASLYPARAEAVLQNLTPLILRETGQLLLKLDGVTDDDVLTGRIVGALTDADYMKWLTKDSPTLIAAATAAAIFAGYSEDSQRRLMSSPAFPWDQMPDDIADVTADAFGSVLVQQLFANHYYGARTVAQEYITARLERRLGENVEAWAFVVQMLPEWSSSLGELIDTARLMFDITDTTAQAEVEVVELSDGQCAFAI